MARERDRGVADRAAAACTAVDRDHAAVAAAASAAVMAGTVSVAIHAARTWASVVSTRSLPRV